MHVSIFVLWLRSSEILKVLRDWVHWVTGSFGTSLSCTFGRSCRFRTLDRRSTTCDVMPWASNSRKEKTRQAKARLPAKDCTESSRRRSYPLSCDGRRMSNCSFWKGQKKMRFSLLTKKANMQRLLILIIAVLECSPRAWIELCARSKADTGTHRRCNRKKKSQSPGISPGTRCTCGIGLVPFERPVHLRSAYGPCFLYSNRFFAKKRTRNASLHHCIIVSWHHAASPRTSAWECAESTRDPHSSLPHQWSWRSCHCLSTRTAALKSETEPQREQEGYQITIYHNKYQ